MFCVVHLILLYCMFLMIVLYCILAISYLCFVPDFIIKTKIILNDEVVGIDTVMASA